MDRSTLTKDLVLSESEVRAVIERAVLIEARNGALSVQELERVAAEAGISSHAISAALRELLESRDAPAPVQRATPEPAPTPTKAPPAAPRRPLLRITTCVFAGWVGGLIASVGEGEAMFACGVLLAATVLRAFRHRRTETPGDFQIELLAAWSSVLVGFGLAEGGIPEELVLGVGVLYIWSAGVGAVISAGKRVRWPWNWWRTRDDDGSAVR